ncbi:MAG: hypothetical protein AAGD25_06520 [Cyanobacteria bacterium P01_F01_bin.150]
MKRNRRLNIRLSEDEYQKIKAYADENDRAVSDVARSFIAALDTDGELNRMLKISEEQTRMVIELMRMAQAIGVEPSEWLKAEAEARGIDLDFRQCS